MSLAAEYDMSLAAAVVEYYMSLAAVVAVNTRCIVQIVQFSYLS